MARYTVKDWGYNGNMSTATTSGPFDKLEDAYQEVAAAAMLYRDDPKIIEILDIDDSDRKVAVIHHYQGIV